MILLLGDGPAQAPPVKPKWGGVLRVFRRPAFRGAALGYFGHMWELYAFWFLVPKLVAGVLTGASAAIPLWSFAVIGAGSVGCVVGGIISQRWGSQRVAAAALAVSAMCCVLFPLLDAALLSTGGLLLIWGLTVVADSPQFSALLGKGMSRRDGRAALAVQNGIGFAITVAAIQLTSEQWASLGPQSAWLLAPVPLLGPARDARLISK